MPQLIAMIIVVVGAIIYMFQTFGGTGDTIKGIAQKTSIITELNNLKLGLRFAAEAGQIVDIVSSAGGQIGKTSQNISEDAVKTLQGLAKLGYFAEQINEQLIASEEPNIYYSISFGGDQKSPKFSLVAPTQFFIPGILVDLSGSKLDDNKDFLEAQIAHDLSSIAVIDRSLTQVPTVLIHNDTYEKQGLEYRLPKTPTLTNSEEGQKLKKDGIFAVYFKDFSASQVVVGKMTNKN